MIEVQFNLDWPAGEDAALDEGQAPQASLEMPLNVRRDDAIPLPTSARFARIGYIPHTRQQRSQQSQRLGLGSGGTWRPIIEAQRPATRNVEETMWSRRTTSNAFVERWCVAADRAGAQ